MYLSFFPLFILSTALSAPFAGKRNGTLVSGALWQWLGDKAKLFAHMGITPHGNGDAYDLSNFGEYIKNSNAENAETRIKYGTEDQLEVTMKTLRENGIGIYLDVNDRPYEGTADQIKGCTKFKFPGHAGKYSDFKWSFQSFIGVDWDDKKQGKRMFRVAGRRKMWAQNVDGEKEHCKNSAKSCEVHLDSFTGEPSSHFDAALHYYFEEAVEAGLDCELLNILEGSIRQTRQDEAITLVNNHDTQAGQALEPPVPLAFMPLAYAIIALCESSTPCVFVGDLHGCHGQVKDQPELLIMPNLVTLIAARRHFAYMMQRDCWEHPSCIGWARGGDEHGHDGCIVGLCIADEGAPRDGDGERVRGSARSM
ncbi:glycoside hydrolase family 13 protein [Tilletiaria anomala UBC 951]|uniref:Glycoside hydrolase family 13 protein n=1 Tax=Tilletiaria anomala (strain ATCC 24038 / CBS 436.72 / UBC 951) TaxID=1037660 RepID=A0A066WL20_TILAU|nr:glycoside hydrolase family 13 protein [Tilletiaria anomala UBC 951]KDN51315.1 glycoside hydrolase family 13 protein [Tilletiaria anomala UBC 951]